MSSLSAGLFAERLCDERHLAGLSQAALAQKTSEMLGYPLDASAVSKIENGSRGVKLVEAVAIAEALDIPLGSLLSDVSAREALIEKTRFALSSARAATRLAAEEAARRQAVVDRLEARLESLSR